MQTILLVLKRVRLNRLLSSESLPDFQRFLKTFFKNSQENFKLKKDQGLRNKVFDIKKMLGLSKLDRIISKLVDPNSNLAFISQDWHYFPQIKRVFTKRPTMG